MYIYARHSYIKINILTYIIMAYVVVYNKYLVKNINKTFYIIFIEFLIVL